MSRTKDPESVKKALREAVAGFIAMFEEEIEIAKAQGQSEKATEIETHLAKLKIASSSL